MHRPGMTAQHTRPAFQKQAINSFHVKNDMLQDDLLQIPSRLKLLNQLQSIHDEKDPDIKMQLEDARQSIREDLKRLDEQGVSVSDFLARFGKEMMEAKIVESRYLLRRFGKPHRDFAQLFREQTEFNKLRQADDEREFRQRAEGIVAEGQNPLSAVALIQQLVNNELLKKTPIATTGDGIPIPSVNVADVRLIDEIEQAKEVAAMVLEHHEVAPIHETQAEVERRHDHQAAAEPFAGTMAAIRAVDESATTQPKNVLDSIQTPADMIEYLHSNKLLNRNRMLKSKRALDRMHGVVSALGHLSSDQKQAIRSSLDSLYESKMLKKSEQRVLTDQL